MSGGIFDGYPFTLNIKCIIFSFIIMITYSFSPPVLSLIPTMLVYFFIFVISYVSLAWYDYYYGCSQLPLQRSKIGITHHLKPPVYDKEKQTDHMFSQKEMEKNHTTIYALHIFLIVPLLVYMGYKRKQTSIMAFNLLLVLAAFTAVYHGVRFMTSLH